MIFIYVFWFKLDIISFSLKTVSVIKNINIYLDFIIKILKFNLAFNTIKLKILTCTCWLKFYKLSHINKTILMFEQKFANRVIKSVLKSNFFFVYKYTIIFFYDIYIYINNNFQYLCCWWLYRFVYIIKYFRQRCVFCMW